MHKPDSRKHRKIMKMENALLKIYVQNRQIITQFLFQARHHFCNGFHFNVKCFERFGTAIHDNGAGKIFDAYSA